MLARHEEYCSAGVAEVVEPAGGQLCSLQEGFEVAAEEVGAAHGGARDGREDEPVVLPERAHPEPLLVLAGAVALEGLVERRVNVVDGARGETAPLDECCRFMPTTP